MKSIEYLLVISNNKEERGCLDDLINLINSVNRDNRKKLTKENSLTSSSSNDQCHRLGSSGIGMSLCKCTSHLCNSSKQHFSLNKFQMILFIFIIYLIIF